MFENVKKQIVPGGFLSLSKPGYWGGVRCWSTNHGVMLVSVVLVNSDSMIKIEQDKRKSVVFKCRCIEYHDAVYCNNTEIAPNKSLLIENPCWIVLSDKIGTLEPEKWLSEDYLWTRENVVCNLFYTVNSPKNFIKSEYIEMRVVEIL